MMDAMKTINLRDLHATTLHEGEVVRLVIEESGIDGPYRVVSKPPQKPDGSARWFLEPVDE